MTADHRLGTITETINDETITIPPTGTWVKEEYSWELEAKQYNIYCPALKGYRKKQGLFIDKLQGVK